jgi:hypothetical protein
VRDALISQGSILGQLGADLLMDLKPNPERAKEIAGFSREEVVVEKNE